jgi:hypothetical protein
VRARIRYHHYRKPLPVTVDRIHPGFLTSGAASHDQINTSVRDNFLLKPGEGQRNSVRRIFRRDLLWALKVRDLISPRCYRERGRLVD